MKQIMLCVTVGTLLCGALAFGKTNTPRKTNSNEDTYSTSNPLPDSRFRASVGPGLGLVDGNFGWGLHADFMINLPETPAYFGFQTGFYHWSTGGTIGFAGTAINISGSASAIPLLAAGYYRFHLTDPNLQLYMGAAIGISITPASASASTNGVTGQSQSDTSVYFMGLLRPGIEFPLAEKVSLAVEPMMGLLKDQFLLMPHAAAQFVF